MNYLLWRYKKEDYVLSFVQGLSNNSNIERDCVIASKYRLHWLIPGIS